MTAKTRPCGRCLKVEERGAPWQLTVWGEGPPAAAAALSSGEACHISSLPQVEGHSGRVGGSQEAQQAGCSLLRGQTALWITLNTQTKRQKLLEECVEGPTSLSLKSPTSQESPATGIKQRPQRKGC